MIYFQKRERIDMTTTILLIIIVVILLIFLGGKFIEDLAELIALIIAGIVGIKRKITKRKTTGTGKPKKVKVYCLCSHSFQAEPKQENGWIVQCPACGRNLRVDTREKA